MATDIRRRFRRPKESSSELVWEDPGSSVSRSSSQLRNHDAQKERRGESPMRRGYVPLSARTPRPTLSLPPVHRSVDPAVACVSQSTMPARFPTHGDNANATHRRVVSVQQRTGIDTARASTRSTQVRKNLDLVYGTDVGVGLEGRHDPGAGRPNHDKVHGRLVPRHTSLSCGEGAQKIRPIIGKWTRLRKGSTHAEPSLP